LSASARRALETKPDQRAVVKADQAAKIAFAVAPPR